MHPVIRVAIGTAGVLGLTNIRQDVLPTTAHLLTPGTCIYNCTFCAQAQDAGSAKLSRISWPEFEQEAVLEALSKDQGKFKRACLQTVQTKGGLEETAGYVKSLRGVLDIPLSVEYRPVSAEEIDVLFELGADMVGIPIDGANDEVYGKVRGGSLRKALEIIEDVSSRYQGRISTHIIVGMGETERDVVELMEKLNGWGVTVGLFALTPLPGTKDAEARAPDIGTYRRVQAAKALIEDHGYRGFRFDTKGRVIGLDDPGILDRITAKAFQTTGCDGCNRPYYNEAPRGVIYNYPRPLTREEYEEAMGSLEL